MTDGAESRKITATAEWVAQYTAGPILTLTFAGYYPPGSAGNECAAEMVSYCFSVLITANPAAVLFDLRRLEYTWGDAIGDWRMCCCRDGAARLRKGAARALPSAIVADGATARSLRPLIGTHTVLGVAGTKMFSTTPEALNYLKRVLEQETG